LKRKGTVHLKGIIFYSVVTSVPKS